jgi:hypothetical protein
MAQALQWPEDLKGGEPPDPQSLWRRYDTE